MANPNMSLDEIIAMTRRGQRGQTSRGGFGRRQNKFSPARGSPTKRGGSRGVGRGGGFRGRWERDSFGTQSRGGGFIAGGAGGPCRVNISNLRNVSVSDLEELFGGYAHDGITMHFDERGVPVGTADIHFKKRPSMAAKLMKDCEGMRIDGRPVKFFLLGPRAPTAFVQKATATRPAFQSRFNKVGQKLNRPQRGRVQKRGGGAGGSNPRKPLTEDELNRELDAYMSGAKK